MITETKYFKEGKENNWTLPEGGITSGVSYSKDIDFEFVLALATIGRVSMNSSQVTLHVSGPKTMKRLKVPSNAVLEWCGGDEGDMMIRFKFEPKEGGAQ